MVKNPPAGAGDARDVGSVPASGRRPGGGNGTRSSLPAWRAPWTREPGGPQSMGRRRVRRYWETERTLAQCTKGQDAPLHTVLLDILKDVFLFFLSYKRIIFLMYLL